MTNEAASQIAPPKMGKVLASAIIGTALEWYDFYLYATASALVFNHLFFPSLNPALGTLASFASYGVGFFFRPLGGFVFGYVGDRFGRRPVMFITLFLMGGGTFLLGCLRSYAQTGLIAPILLVTLRAIQGLGAGAEFGSAVSLTTEAAPSKRRGFFSSLAANGIALGIVLSSGAFTAAEAIGGGAFLDFAWRLPFLVSIVAVAVGLWVRFRVSESQAFLLLKKERKAPKNPLALVWKESRKEFFVAFGVRMAENGSGFFLQTWLLSYMTSQVGIPAGIGVTAVTIAAAIGLLTVPTFGWLSHKVGRKPVLFGGAILFGLGVFPMFWVIGTQNTALITVAMTIMVAGADYAMFAVDSTFFAELFPTRTRVSGVALSRELSAVFAGGLAPVISSLLIIVAGGSYVLVALYMILLALITVASLLVAKETRGRDLNEENIPQENLSISTEAIA